MVEVYVAADPVAEQVAREWLALTDAGRVEESYAASAALFRRPLTVTSWSLESSAVRACLGAVRSRLLCGVRETRRMVGAPKAEYRVVRFRTVFEHGDGALDERVE